MLALLTVVVGAHRVGFLSPCLLSSRFETEPRSLNSLVGGGGDILLPCGSTEGGGEAPL